MEAVLCAAMKQILATNRVKSKFLSNCTPIASTKYLEQHNKVAKYLHWHMFCDRKMPVCKQWWQYKLLQAM
eukprot:5228932-Ditylum_brightwellii.AAC.1